MGTLSLVDDSMVELGRLDLGRAWRSAGCHQLPSFSTGDSVPKQHSYNQGMVFVAGHECWTDCRHVAECDQPQGAADLLSICHPELLYLVPPLLDLVSSPSIGLLPSFQHSVRSL